MNFRHPRKEKLKSEKLIQAVFEKGESVTAYPLKLIFLASPASDPKIQAAVTVPKKNFRSAVKRNSIKRLMREAYRLNKHHIFNKIEGSYAFMFLYLGKEIPSYGQIEGPMIKLLEKVLILANDEEVDT
jgi:ribonuclease P protein component